jgi:hypothetical protein
VERDYRLSTEAVDALRSVLGGELSHVVLEELSVDVTNASYAATSDMWLVTNTGCLRLSTCLTEVDPGEDVASSELSYALRVEPTARPGRLPAFVGLWLKPVDTIAVYDERRPDADVAVVFRGAGRVVCFAAFGLRGRGVWLSADPDTVAEVLDDWVPWEPRLVLSAEP